MWRLYTTQGADAIRGHSITTEMSGLIMIAESRKMVWGFAEKCLLGRSTGTILRPAFVFAQYTPTFQQARQGYISPRPNILRIAYERDGRWRLYHRYKGVLTPTRP